MRFEIGDAPVSLPAFVAAAAGPVDVRLSDGARQRIGRSRAVVDHLAERDAPVYGLNTGLGSNLHHRLGAHDVAALQAQVLAGRSVGTGPPLPENVSRAALLARVIGAANGASGLSPAVVGLMIRMLRAGLAPVIPSRGSIGAGDLVQGAAMGRTLLGEGEVWSGGVPVPAAEALLLAADLEPATLGTKDGLALANHSAVTTARAAFTAERCRKLLLLWRGVAALAGEGYAMNTAIFDERLQRLRPAAGQEAAAAWFRRAFAGSTIAGGGARSIQDALSFRTMAPVFGAALTAHAGLERETLIELNGAADNPAVLDGDESTMLSSANFHTGSLSLACDALTIALVHVATASAQRVVKLMAPGLSGLPKYLSPVGGASAGLMPLQKTLAALLGEARLHASPASLDALVVSEMVEDVAPQTPQTVRKLEQQEEVLEDVLAIEALVAAQAVDLRGHGALGAAGRIVFTAVREVVPKLEEDRALGPEIARAGAALDEPAVVEALAAIG